MKTSIIAAAVAAIALPSLAAAQEFNFEIDPSTGDVVVSGQGVINGFTFTSDNAALQPGELPNLFGGVPISTSEGDFLLAAIVNNQSELTLGANPGSLGPNLAIEGFSFAGFIDTSLIDTSLSAEDQFSLSVLDINETSIAGTVTFVPEPASAGLMGIAALGMLRRRRA